MTGKLTVCPTPIGNLDDVSPRQREALVSADIIACEDTRTTGKLLNLLGIDRADGTPKLVSYHDHNEESRAASLIQSIQDGDRVTLVSDAGTPTISDPGFRLVAAAANVGIEIESLPGPCAAIVAIAASGLPTDRFLFEGFLGSKSSERKKRLEHAMTVGATVVAYESPKRLVGLLDDAADVLGSDAQVCVGRELTKKYETFYRGTIADVKTQLPESIKGECVVVFGPPAATSDDHEALALTKTLLEAGVSPAQIKAVVKRHYNVSKSTVFEWLESLKR